MELTKILPLYLPYGLRVKFPKNYQFGDGIKSDQETFILNGIKDGCISVEGSGCFHQPESGKYLMRPLDDLAKPIKVDNGEDFVPIIKLPILSYEVTGIYSIDDIYINDHFTLGDSIKATQLLLQWHFDIFSLIPKGEALNLNDYEIQ